MEIYTDRISLIITPAFIYALSYMILNFIDYFRTTSLTEKTIYAYDRFSFTVYLPYLEFITTISLGVFTVTVYKGPEGEYIMKIVFSNHLKKIFNKIHDEWIAQIQTVLELLKNFFI